MQKILVTISLCLFAMAGHAQTCKDEYQGFQFSAVEIHAESFSAACLYTMGGIGLAYSVPGMHYPLPGPWTRTDDGTFSCTESASKCWFI